jgi:hypothetical protein
MFFKYTFHRHYELIQEPIAGPELLMRKPQPGSSVAHCALAWAYPDPERSLKALRIAYQQLR